MSGGTATTPEAAATNSDPSMEDILASIRRILSEDEAPPEPAGEALPAGGPAAPGGSLAPNIMPNGAPPKPILDDDDVLELDETMVVPPRPAPVAVVPTLVRPAVAVSNGLMADATESAAANSVGALVRSLAAERNAQVFRGGPSLEDMVLEVIRPMLKLWLDENLPPMVERLVRNEIERVAARATCG